MTANDHGKPSTANNYGCKCKECRIALYRYKKFRRIAKYREAQANVSSKEN